MLADLNGWVGDRARFGIVGAFEFQEGMIMEEELCSSILRGGFV